MEEICIHSQSRVEICILWYFYLFHICFQWLFLMACFIIFNQNWFLPIQPAACIVSNHLLKDRLIKLFKILSLKLMFSEKAILVLTLLSNIMSFKLISFLFIHFQSHNQPPATTGWWLQRGVVLIRLMYPFNAKIVRQLKEPLNV